MSLENMFESFGDKILNVLPLSPFTGVIDAIGSLPHLDWLNWFVPVGELCRIFGLWLGAVAIFYLYQIVLRWLKVIQG